MRRRIASSKLFPLMLGMSLSAILFPLTTASAVAERRWGPHVDVTLKPGNERLIGEVDLFVPAWQDYNSLFFMDFRVQFDDESSKEGNWGLGWRQIVNPNWLVGGYAFLDARRTRFNNTFVQGTVGLEALSPNWDFRVNGYIPGSGKQSVSRFETPGSPGGLGLIGTDVVLFGQSPGFTIETFERAMRGFDIELGRKLVTLPRRPGDAIRAYIGGYHFMADGVDDVTGPRARLEMRLNEPFGWKGSNFELGAEVRHDDVRDSDFFFEARLRIPLDGVAKSSRGQLSSLSLLEQRMTNRVRRDPDIVTNQATAITGNPNARGSVTPVLDPASGQQLNIYFVDQAGGGVCTQLQPCAIGAAQADGKYGFGDVLVPLSRSGTIRQELTLTHARQQFVGGGDTGAVTLNLSSGHRFPLSSLGARPSLQGTLTLSDQSVIGGFDLIPASPGIVGNNVSATIDGLNISGGEPALRFTGTGDITVSNTAIRNAQTAAVELASFNGSFAYRSGSVSSTAAQPAVTIDGGNGQVSFDVPIANTGGPAASIVNRGGGSVGFTGAVSGGGIVLRDNPGGTINFTTVALNPAAGQSGINATGANTLAVRGGSITSTGAAFAAFSNTAGSYDFTGLTTVQNSAGLSFDNTQAGTYKLGNVTINNAPAAGVAANGSPASIEFSSLNVNNAGAQGLQLANNSTTSFTVTGATQIANAAGNGIDISGTGTYRFGDVTITGNTATGLNLQGADATLTANTLNVDGGTTGIDLTGTLNNRDITITNGGTIQNVATGVQFSNTQNLADTANANFRYGGGSIAANTFTLDTRGLNGASGLYDFTGVTFIGRPSFTGADLFFVSAGGTGSGATELDPANIAAAQALASDPTDTHTFVLIDDGNAIDVGGGFTLGANDRIDGFGNGNTINASFTPPPNVIGNFGGATISDPTGNGAAALTGAGTLVTVADNNVIENIELSGGINSITGNGFNGLVIADTVFGGATGATFDFTGSLGPISLTNNTVNSTAANLLDLDGGSADITLGLGTGANLAGRGLVIANTAGGSVDITGANLTTAGNTAVTLDGNVAPITLTDLVVNRAAGNTAFDIDATTASAGAITFGGTSTLDNNTGAAFVIGAGARDIAASGLNIAGDNAAGALVSVTGQTGGTISLGNLSSTGATGTNLISSSLQTGGTLNFANVLIRGYGNAATDTAINLSGSGIVTFDDLDVETASGNALLASGISLDEGAAASRLTATGGFALDLDNVTAVGGTLDVQANSTSSAGNGISLANLTTGNTINFNNLSSITNAAGTGLLITGGAADINYAGTLSSNAGRAVDIQNRAGGTVGITGAVTASGASTGINIAGSTAANTVSFSGPVDLGTSASRLTGGTALTIDNNGLSAADAVVSFANLNVFTNGQIGVDASNGGTLNVTTGTIDTTGAGATGLRLNGLTAGMSFASVNVDNIGAANPALDIDNLAGSFAVTGATNIGVTGTVGTGIAINGGNATYNFGAVNIDNRNGVGIDIDTTSGTLNFGATTISGAGAGTAGIDVAGTTAGSVTLASTNIDNNGGAGAGIALTNNAATFTSSGGTIQGSAGAEVDIDQGAADVTIASAITNTAGRAVDITNRTGGTATLSGAINDTGGTGINLATNTAGSINFSGAATLNTAANNAITLSGNNGAVVLFSNVNLDTTTGTGVAASGTNSSVTVSGTNDATAGAALSFTNTAGTYNYAGLTTIQTGAGLSFDATQTGTYNLGTVTINNAPGAGVAANGSPASLNFTALTVNNAGAQGLQLANNSTTSFSVTGGTLINNAAGNGIDITGTGTYSFGDIDITNNNAIGLDMQGANARFTANTLDISGGPTGIDLTGSANPTGNPNTASIVITNGGVINTSAIGVELNNTNNTANAPSAHFVFGGGSITAPTTVDAIGIVSNDPFNIGRFDFTGVSFTGTPGFASAGGTAGALYFVGAAAAGTGDGSSPANRASLADAQTQALLGTINTFVFVKTAAAEVIDLSGLLADGFNLGAGDAIAGFGNGASFGLVQPVNVIGNFGGVSFTDPFGFGAAVLSNPLGAAVTVASNNAISNIAFDGGIDSIGGSGFSGLFVSNNIFGGGLGGASGSTFNFLNPTGTLTLANNTINQANANLLTLNGGTATVDLSLGTGTSLIGQALDIRNTAGGAVNISGASLTTAGNSAVTLNGNAAPITLTNLAITRAAGDTGFDIDATAPSTAAITLAGTNSMNNVAGTAFRIGAGARNINASSLAINNAGTTTGSVIQVTGQSGGTINFGATNITGFGGGNTAVSLAGTGGSVLFADLDILTTAGNALFASGISLDEGASSTLNATGGFALDLSNVTAAGGVFDFEADSTGSTGNGIRLNNITTGNTINFNNLSSITNAAGTGLLVTGGAANINYAGTLGSNAGRAVDIQTRAGGTIDIDGAITATGASTGINISGATAANTVRFDGAVDLGTGASRLTGGTALTVNNNAQAGALVSFADLDVFTSGQAGINASNGGTLNLTTGNINTTGAGATGLRLNGLTAGMTFASISVDNIGAVNPALDIDNLIGSFAVTGATNIGATGAVGSGIAITGGSANYTFGPITIANRNAAGIDIDTTSGALTFGATTITGAGAGTAGIDVNGTTAGSLTFTSTSIDNSGGAGAGITLTNNAASFTSSGGTIQGSTAAEVDVNGGTGAVTLASTIANTAGRAVDVRNRTNGLVAFTGPVTDSGGTGLSLSNNTANAIGNISFANVTLNPVAGTSAINITGANNLTISGPAVSPAFDVTTSNAGFASFTNTSGAYDFSGLRSTQTGAGLLFNNTHTGTYNLGEVTINNAPGAGFTMTGSAANITLGSLAVANSVGAGISLSNNTGTFTSNGGAITNAGGIGIDIDQGSAAITIANSVSNATDRPVEVTGRTGGTVTLSGNINETAGPGINVANNTGGTTTFSGTSKVLNTGANTAVTLATNTGHTVNFSGGGLDIDTTSGTGFSATGGGTVTVQGTGNSITSGAGTALNVANTTIGAAGLNFQSITSNGTATANGIVLDSTGASGGLTVTGAGTAGSGGTIANKQGADGSTTSGIGIYLNNTSNVSLAWMQLNDFQNFAIRGSNVNGFTLNNSVINGANGTNPTGTIREGSVRFNNLIGSATVANTAISGGRSNNFEVINSGSGSLNRITFSSVTIGPNHSTDGNDGILLETDAAATGDLRATIQNSVFTSAAGDLLQFSHNGTGVGDLVLTNNAFSNNHPTIATGGGGVSLFADGNTTMNITGNTFRDAVGTAVLIAKTATDATTLDVTFDNNTIGVDNLANSGSREGSGLKLQTIGGGTLTARIRNNNIFGYNNFGIEVLAGGGASAIGGNLNVTMTGNRIEDPGNTAGTLSFPKNGIHLNIGTNVGDTFSVCAVIGGTGALANSISTSGKDAVPATIGDLDFRLRQRQSTTIRLPGYSGANNDNTAVQNFVIANNSGDGAPTGLAQNTVPTGGGFIGTGTGCP